MIELRELVAAALQLQHAWMAQSIPFCFIGGLAVQRWGEPRYTRDVDATIFVGFGGEREAVEGQLKRLRSRIDGALEFALLNRVLLVEDAGGCPIDLSLGAMPYERQMIERSSEQIIDPALGALRICSPSDLMILKTFAGRPQDWLDVRGTIIRSSPLLDWPLIERELAVLLALKEEQESMDRLSKLRQELAN